jgi:hypothetical protein
MERRRHEKTNEQSDRKDIKSWQRNQTACSTTKERRVHYTVNKTERKKDRKTERQKNRKTENKKIRKTERQKDIKTERK